MYCKFTLFYLIYQICTVTSVGVIETCVVDILSAKSMHGSNVGLIKSNICEDTLIQNLHATNNIKLYVKDYSVSMKSLPDAYVIYSEDKEGLSDVLQWMNRDWYRQPHALFIIALRKTKEEELPAIFELFLEFHLIHVVIVIEDDEDASIYSYLPYAPGSCGRHSNTTITLERCSDAKDLDVIKLLQEYDKPDLKNCRFDILAHHYPPMVMSDLKPEDRFAVGVERFLVELLLEVEKISLNFTFVPQTVEFGNISENMTVTGLMSNLFRNKVDLLFGGFSLSSKRALLFDAIYSHLAFEDIFIPVTPSAGLEDRWKNVYMMFQYKVWMLLILTMIFCSIMLSNFNSIIRCKNSSQLLKLFGNATQNVTLKLRRQLYENLIITHWLWFTFLVTCYYIARLTSYSTFRSYKPQINEYMSLMNYNLTPCINRDIVQFLKSSEIAPIINERYLDTYSCETTDLALNEIAHSSSKYTVTTYYLYLWWAAKHLKEKNRIHVMQENIYKTHYALFLKRGFPLMRKFEITMLRIVESGFVYAIKGMHRIPNHSRYASRVSGAFEVRLLTLNDLFIPFTIVAVGQVFALVVFIVEVSHKSDRTLVLYQM